LEGNLQKGSEKLGRKSWGNPSTVAHFWKKTKKRNSAKEAGGEVWKERHYRWRRIQGAGGAKKALKVKKKF